jgi:predicted dithiol-disulfide oxidoreductase (DUF899 family)
VALRQRKYSDEIFKAEKGWIIPWFPSFDRDFNYDSHVTLDDHTAPPEDNYRN